MNCCNCGGEIQEPAGHICGECLDESGQSEMITALQKSGAVMLSPRQAINAMLGGAVLTDQEGSEVMWDAYKSSFVDCNSFENYKNKPWHCFSGLYFKKKTRPMTRLEILAWAQGPESRGWLVNVRGKGYFGLKDDWQLPAHYKYDGFEDKDSKVFEYVRAPILPDLSGVDEARIEKFEAAENAP